VHLTGIVYGQMFGKFLGFRPTPLGGGKKKKNIGTEISLRQKTTAAKSRGKKKGYRGTGGGGGIQRGGGVDRF